MKQVAAKTMVLEFPQARKDDRLPLRLVVACGVVNLLSILLNVVLIAVTFGMSGEPSPERSMHLSLLACWVSMIAVVFCCGLLCWAFGRKC